MDDIPAGPSAGPPSSSSALDDVLGWLQCPHCAGSPLDRAAGGSVRCPSGHSFDVARQGYVSLLAGGGGHRGDDAAMVLARERFLERDHFRPLRRAVCALAAEHAPEGSELVVDLACGTGHYLAAVLDALPDRRGVGVDVSSAALRRAARAHPRAAAVAADVWARLPLRPEAAAVVLSVFGPRTVAEVERVLARDGILLMASAAPEHLQELPALVGGIGVDQRKRERLEAAFHAFELVVRQPVTWPLALSRDEVEELVAMGPSARHVDRSQLRERLDRLPDVIELNAAVDVTVWRR